jgi:DNA-directed RNA polymerase subunit RPC12/RpoP
MPKCPNCGANHYAYLYSTSTCLYIPQVYKDDKLVEPLLKNQITYVYQCMDCNKQFSSEVAPPIYYGGN